MKLYVYGLFEATDIEQQVFYVGLTSNIRQRKTNHAGHSWRAVGRHIRKLRALNSDFSVKTLEITDEVNGPERESWWIAKLCPELNSQKFTARNIPRELPGIVYDGTLADLRRQTIAKILSDCRGNISAAAVALGIGRQTLYNALGKR